MSTRDELCGRTVGEFVLRERIGEGGFAAVYRCEQTLLGRQAVVKVLHRRFRDSAVDLQRFMREAQLASRLDHPYAAHVYAFGVEQEDGLFWIAMELVQGTTLDRWLRERGPFSIAELVPFFERVAEVVETAHERGIVHRDLKPANIMIIERAGRVLPKLLDFGIAKLLGAAPLAEREPGSSPDDSPSDARDTRRLRPDGGSPADSLTTMDAGQAAAPGDALGQPLTRSDAALGSPPYMSPEQWTNTPAVGPRSDLYALGIVAYECLTGRRPFIAGNSAGYADQHCNADIPSLGEGFPPALDRFFQRALAKHPEDRPASALELAAGLRVASGLSVEAVELPRLDDGIRDAWLAGAPQPLAEGIAVLEGARNVHQARDAARDLFRGLVRYLLVIALAARTQVRDGRDGPALLDMLRAMRRRELDDEHRIRLLRLLCEPFEAQRAAHPIPELVDLVAPRSGGGVLDPILALHAAADRGGAEDQVRAQLGPFMAELTRMMRACAFVLEYPLVVPRDRTPERWTGLRRQLRAPAAVTGGELRDGHPVLIDRHGRAAMLLWPLAQTRSPAAGAEAELFVFDGPGRQGARLVAAPAGFEVHDPAIWDWFSSDVLGDAAEVAAERRDERPPYLGLAPFSEADADRFVGREREIEACVNRLRRQPLQVVIGPSGAGKSSFIHAGVVPALPAGWRAIGLRPGTSPLAALAACFTAAKVTTTDLRAVLETSPAATAALVAHAAADRTIVIVVDQLEEMFTLCASAVERDRFAAVIAGLAASPDGRLRVICTLRDDFLMHLEAYAPLRALLAPSLVLLGNPSRTDLIRIVVEPAARAGYEPSDPELASDMANEVADRPGALALLSFTASRLWELRDRRFRQLTRNAYAAMGGVGGALGRHAEAVLEALTSDEQTVAREIFCHLVTADGTRAVLGGDELRQRVRSPRAGEMIDKLVAARLLAIAEVDGGTRIELVHEALIAAWPRLHQWVRDDAGATRMHEQVRAAASQWHERGRTRSLLWRDDLLAELEQWRRRSGASMADRELAFADASRAAAVRGRRLRRATLTLAFAALAAVAIAMFELRQEATEQAALATRRGALADAQKAIAAQRLAKSYEERGQQALLASDSDAALAFLSAALSAGDDTPAVRFMIAGALEPWRAEIATLRGHAGEIWQVSFGPDGSRVLTAGNDGTATVWDARTGARLVALSGHQIGVLAAAWSPDGTTIATGDAAGAVRWWTTDGALTRTRSHSPAAIHWLAFSPDGARIAAASSGDGAITVWDAERGDALATWRGDAPIFSVSFDRSGTRMLAAAYSGRVSLVSTAGALLAELSEHVEPAWYARFSPSGDRVATASLDGTARIWIPNHRSRVLRGHENIVTHVAWSPTGRAVATASADRTARLWDPASGESSAILRGHAAQVNHVEFTPDGTQLATTANDGTARIWDATTGLQTSVFSHAGFVYDAAIDPAGARLVTASWSGTAKLWDLRRQDCIATLAAPTQTTAIVRIGGERALMIVDSGAVLWDAVDRPPRRFAATGALAGDLARDGRWLVLGTADGDVHIHAAEGAASPVAPLRVHTGPVLRLAISPGGDRFASWGLDHALALRDPRGEPIARREVAHAATVETADDLQLAFSPRGDVLAAFDLARAEVTLVSGADLHPIATLATQANSLAFATDGRSATGGKDRTVRVWDARGQLIKALPPARFAISRIAWSPSAGHLVVGGLDGSLEIWNARTWTVVAERKVHDNAVTAIAFADDRFVATGSFDHFVRLWDAETMTEVGAIKGDDAVTALQIDATRRLFETGQFAHRTHVWRLVAPYDGSAAQLARLLACRASKAIVEGRLVVNESRAACE